MNRLRVAFIISLLIGTTLNACKKEEVPTITTSEITDISGTTALCGGTIIAEGSGTVTARGVCWSTNINPTIADKKSTDGAGAGTFISNITGLDGGTSYYVRAYATNSVGTGYGMAMAFTSKLVDIDGNIYKIVKIGTQIWMAENLKTRKYSNGEAISTGIYVQNNNENNATTYGRLYTWNTATDSRKVCPTGWHVPADIEWGTLLSNVQSPDNLKESGYSHWFSPNSGATNSVGFTALPGGYFAGSAFTDLQATASFWLSDEKSPSTGRGFLLYYNNSPTTGDYVNVPKTNAYSIRCIRD